jgi:two-component system OmpR family sensor kinase
VRQAIDLWSRLSLRARTLIAVALLAGLGLAIADTLTAVALRAFLVQQVDQQLAQDRLSVALASQSPGALQALINTIPQGYVAVVNQDGQVLLDFSSRNPMTQVPGPSPQLSAVPSDVWSQLASANGEYWLTVPSASAGAPFRIHIEPVSRFGVSIVIGQSLAQVDRTVAELVTIEVVVSAAALAAILGIGLWLVRVGLRPLQQIASTADSIAAGDLTARVPEWNPATEVGRVATAFNAMLGRIERAFSEQRASEERLRRFTADAAHELRTPLTSVRGYAELFRRGARDRPEDLARVMAGIEEEASRMGVLVEDLLLLARLDQGRPLERHPVDLEAVVTRAVEAARAVEPERPISLQTDRVQVAGDPNRLRQVIDNLLANVRVHTPPATPAWVRVARADGQAVVEVADSGPGIPPAMADRIFERFFRVDPGRARQQGGTGLGLSIVQAIAQAHGGRVEVRSAEGGGAIFRVLLPEAQEQLPRPPGVAPAAASR